jgi:hypothetical protein
MTFKDAVMSGKKVRSVQWRINKKSIDTTIFTETLGGMALTIMSATAIPLTWEEILGEWELVE